ncbi:Lysozyme RrrD [compost metagenome]
MSSIVKRCVAATILAIAMLIPQFEQVKTSENGLKLITDFEGCRLSPYQCDAGVWTQGVGHTAGVIPGATITEEKAAADFLTDVRRIEQGVASCIPQALPQEIYDAVIAFAFNVGVNAACGSTLAYFLNQHLWQQACDQLPRWIYINGKKSKGLERRRAEERKLCLKGAGRAS